MCLKFGNAFAISQPLEQVHPGEALPLAGVVTIIQILDLFILAVSRVVPAGIFCFGYNRFAGSVQG